LKPAYIFGIDIRGVFPYLVHNRAPEDSTQTGNTA